MDDRNQINFEAPAMAFDTGVEHLARELALSNPGQP